jgi:hypothetical protein
MATLGWFAVAAVAIAAGGMVVFLRHKIGKEIEGGHLRSTNPLGKAP